MTPILPPFTAMECGNVSIFRIIVNTGLLLRLRILLLSSPRCTNRLIEHYTVRSRMFLTNS